MGDGKDVCDAQWRGCRAEEQAADGVLVLAEMLDDREVGTVGERVRSRHGSDGATGGQGRGCQGGGREKGRQAGRSGLLTMVWCRIKTCSRPMNKAYVDLLLHSTVMHVATCH